MDRGRRNNEGQGAGTAQNGNQTINVGAGAIKFSIAMGKWPFLSATNKVRVGIAIQSKSKNETQEHSKVQKREGKGESKNGKVDRMDFGGGLFMDSPCQAVVDNNNTAITSYVDISGSIVVIDWEFPFYSTSLYYDPVLGADSSVITSSTTGSSSGGTKTTGSSSKSNSSSLTYSTQFNLLASFVSTFMFSCRFYK